MSDWSLVQTITITDAWKFIDVDSAFIRISHIIVGDVDTKLLKGAIARGAIIGGKPNTYKSQLLSYRDEPETFWLESPIPSLSKLGIKRLDSNENIWKIKIYRYVGNINDTFIVNEIAKKLMSYFNVESYASNTQLIPMSTTVECIKDKPGLLIKKNKKREFLTIKNYGDDFLKIGLAPTTNAVNQVTGLEQEFENIPAKKGYNFPSVQGIVYKGDVYGLSKFNGKVEITEWIAELISDDES